MGRPSKYTEPLGEKISALLMAGYSLRKICERDEFPSAVTIFSWLAQENHPFLKQYETGRRVQAEFLADELVDISDERPTHEVPDPDGGVSVRIDSAGVQRNRLRVDTRKWIASKLLAKKYGDKTQLTGADGDGPVEIAVKRVVADL